MPVVKTNKGKCCEPEYHDPCDPCGKCDVAKLATHAAKLLVTGDYDGLAKLLTDDAIINFTDPTDIIPYAGTFSGTREIKRFFDLLRAYVIPVLNDIEKPFVQVNGNGHHVIVKAKLVQQNRQVAFGAPQEKPFEITETIEIHVNSKCRITRIDILSNSTALVLFYQFPITNGPVYNNYKLLLTVGQDEDLPIPGFEIGAPALTKFTTIFGLTPAQIEALRQNSIAWFIERFGIDMSNAFPLGGGFYTNGTAIMYPIYADVNYRVYQSTSTQIPVLDPNSAPKVELIEWVVGFTGFPAPVYRGTYAAGAGPDGAQGFTGDALAYGIYMISVNNDIYGYPRKFRFYMRSYLPGRSDPYPLENNGAPNINPTFTIENFQFYSPEFGPGAGHLIAIVVATPNAQNKYPTRYRATWSFPGSYAFPQLNGFTSAPNL